MSGICKRLPEWVLDLVLGMVGCLLVAMSVHNFALYADFPMTGFSGIALIFYRLFGLPVGMMTILLNIPVALIAFKLLGRRFFLKSLIMMVVSSLMIDYLAPLFPAYQGDRLLAAICTGVVGGLGYALIFMRGASTGGADFVIMSLKALRPHLSIGTISFAIDLVIVLAGGFLLEDVDGVLYGLIVSYLLAQVIDKVTYRIDQGKTALIVTDRGREVAQAIDREVDRGSTVIEAKGGYQGDQRQLVLCACNNKEMVHIRALAKAVDPKSFVIIMESNEVVGEGFKAS